MSINIKNKSEIDLLNLIKIFWHGKLTLISITLILTLIAAIYGYKQPTLYSFSTKINKSQTAIFNNYKITNDILSLNSFPLSINPKTIFEKFIYRANNYKEIISVLKNNPFVKLKLVNLDDASKQKMLLSYARAFKISVINSKTTIASFEWHDINEGLLLFEQVMQKSLENIKIDITKEIEQASIIIDLIKDNRIKNLNKSIDNILELEKIKIAREILILEELYSMAKELGIEKNIFSENNGSSFTVIKDYHRGYRAIRKEIDILKERTDSNKIRSSFEYVNLSENIYRIKNDTSSTSLSESIKALEEDKVNDWVNYNPLSISIERLSTEPKRFLIFGLILGLVLGALYIIIRDIILNLKIIMKIKRI